MLTLISLVVGVALVVLIVGGGDDSSSGKRASATTKPAVALPPIEGLKIEFEGLIYNVTDARVLDPDSPSDEPYLTNLQRPPKGTGFLGVFLRVYNPAGHAAVSAPAFLLEPTKQPGLVEQTLPSESRYAFEQGAKVPANGVTPVPGSPTASGPIPGGMLLFPISTETTKAQPFNLVIHTAKGGLASLRLARVPKLTGGSDQG